MGSVVNYKREGYVINGGRSHLLRKRGGAALVRLSFQRDLTSKALDHSNLEKNAPRGTKSEPAEFTPTIGRAARGADADFSISSLSSGGFSYRHSFQVNQSHLLASCRASMLAIFFSRIK